MGADQHERLPAPNSVPPHQGKQGTIASRPGGRHVQKTMSAPVTAILANEMRFYEKLPKLMPHNPNAVGFFQNSPELAQVTARRNATLQGAYFMLGARAMG